MKSPAFNHDYGRREMDCLDAIREPVVAVLGAACSVGWSQEEFADALCNLADELLKLPSCASHAPTNSR